MDAEHNVDHELSHEHLSPSEPHSAKADEIVAPAECEQAQEPEAPFCRAGHSLLDVLFPATPPEPRNPRVIRHFDK